MTLLVVTTRPPAVLHLSVPIAQDDNVILGGLTDARFGRPSSTSLAISPDGDLLIYSARDGAGTPEADSRLAAEAVAPNNDFSWTAVFAGPEGTTHFVVTPAGSFSDSGMDALAPPEVLAPHYGMTEARALMEMFAGAMTFRQSRMWARRPDLSFGSN